MTQILADAEMAKKIAEANGTINIVDATGTVIASCTPLKATGEPPAGFPVPPPAFPHSPYTREEVEAARRQCRETGGKPLAGFLEKLEEQHP